MTPKKDKKKNIQKVKNKKKKKKNFIPLLIN
jgi:hypothetical protein